MAVRRITPPAAVILLASMSLLIGARGRPRVALIAVGRASAVGALRAVRLLSSPDPRASLAGSRVTRLAVVLLAVAVLAIVVLIAVSVLSTVPVPGTEVRTVGLLRSLRVVSAVRGPGAGAVRGLR